MILNPIVCLFKKVQDMRKPHPISRGQCEPLPVTLTLSAVDARWLMNGFHSAQRQHCIQGSKRWFEGEELVERVRGEINRQVNYENFA